ncbi:hypothetical protein LZ554_007119 [Drepanopeziza brunnea f. sp. 'monogermtubi']|nr:hypothetical protein LZ554_007119 [Drepanopeziza brunnea f. sp. 'monogermtubi']
MGSQTPAYPIPPGVHAISNELLDLRPDSEIDYEILHPKPITTEKNIFFFWDSGFKHMHPCTQRTVRAWHRRFSRSGWTIYVIDRHLGSPMNVENFLDVNDRSNFPQAFAEGTVTGTYAVQHTSDLVRWPLLLKYGGVYADVGLMQIGDLDALWNKTVGDPESGYEILSYNQGPPETYCLTNYFFCARKNNPLFERAHRLLLKLWEGRTCTEGLHSHPLLNGIPLMGGSHTIDDEKGMHDAEETSRMLTDYVLQGQVTTLVMGLVDEEGGWNGPKYVREKIYAMDFMVGSLLINEIIAWDGQKAFDLMSLPLPKVGETESAEQAQARNIVEQCLKRSFGFKLAHGFILRVYRETLGTMWRKHTGSDAVVGTYAHWLRYGMVHWCQVELPEKMEYAIIEPLKMGPLLKDA